MAMDDVWREEQGDTEREKEGFSDEEMERKMVVGRSSDGEVKGKQVPLIHWDKMVDQPSETKVEWSFLDDERNQFAPCKQWWLYERMWKEESLREQLMAAEKVKREAVAAYQRSIERFQELLLVLMHFAEDSQPEPPSC